MTPAFALFDTAIGPCAIAWGGAGVVGMWFPGPTPDHTRASIHRRHPDALEAAPTPPIARAIDALQALLETGRGDLNFIELDLAGARAFDLRVYDEARSIPAGETRTYGDIARRLGDVALSREVGQALGRNPYPMVVPCHRVLAAGGKTGGFSAPGGVDSKLRLLTIERARTSDAPLLFDDLPIAARPPKSH